MKDIRLIGIRNYIDWAVPVCPRCKGFTEHIDKDHPDTFCECTCAGGIPR